MSEPESAGVVARLQLVLDVLARALDRAVLLEDESLTPIAYSRQLGELDDVRTYSVLQRRTPPAVKAAIFAMGIRAVTDAIRTPARPEHGMMARFCVPVCSSGERIGYLWVLDPDESLPEQGQELARQAGRDLQAILDRRNAALRAAETVNQALVARLLACAAPDGLDELLPDLQELGIAQQDSMVSVFAFAPGQTGSPSPLERTMALRLRVATTEPSHSWFTLAGKPTAIVAVSRSPVRVDAARLTDAVVDAVEHCYGERPAIGWSGSRVPVYAAAQAFRHARLALNLARIGVPGDHVTSWTKLGSWQTLALLADSYSDRPAELATLVHPGIVGLIDDGRGNLLHTLDVYLAHGGDARKTADALHLHRSTLYYRLEKITEAVGGDLSDGEARFELMLGIRLAYLAGLYRHSSVIGRVGVLRQLSGPGADGSDDGPMRGSGGRG